MSSKYPILFASAVVPTESGNPFHDVTTGRFSFAPPGVNVISGRQFLRQIDTNSRKKLFARAKLTGANQLAVKEKDGQIIFVLFKDGRALSTFSFPQVGQEGQKAPAQIPQTGALRDALIDAARNPSLTGDRLESFLTGRLGDAFDPSEFGVYEKMIDELRLNDLLDYLHQNLRRKLHGEKQTDKIRISTPRGYLAKTFAWLDEEKTRLVLDRLRARGWSENDIQENVINQFPKRLQKFFPEPNKGKKPDEAPKSIDSYNPPESEKNIRREQGSDIGERTTIKRQQDASTVR